MKPIMSRLTTITPFLFFPLYMLFLKKRKLAYFVVALLAISISSCYLHYYKTNSSKTVDAATIQKLMYANKYFILHSGNNAYALTHIKTGNDVLEGDADTLADQHGFYLHPKNSDANRFSAEDKSAVLYEVHLYSQDSVSYNSRVSIPFKDFYRMDVYELNKGRTSGSAFISTVGIIVFTIGIIGIIAAASLSDKPSPGTSESCSPQAYVINNNKPELKGTLYSGAIYASLERTDYLPLTNVNSTEDKLHMMIKGEKNEQIMINKIKLLQVTHTDEQNILIDRKGEMLVYEKPESPQYAFIGNGQDVVKDVNVRDGIYYSFTDDANGQNSSDIILDFKKPAGASSAKLILNAKNSPWSFYLFKQFKTLYGNYYDSLIQKKDKADPKKVMQCELDQYLPILVSVKYPDGWKFVDYFITPGNAAPRDLIMKMDLADLKNADHLQVRLQTTYMFWDLDYVGMDFSQNNSIATAYLPVTGMSMSNGDSKTTVAIPENKNYVTVNNGEQLNLEFAVNSNPGNGLKNSYFLVGNGYYHDKTHFNGKPQINELSKFSGKGAFDKYSREKFDEIVKSFNNDQDKNLTSAK